ncbi:hypothetical protein PanWU01x14_148130 [Parasponia andersonii]|uniref:Uncharacterized protein n=1 Tax=Parasponia andersonii TaxID=3476 RepID=A0A2P5CJ03_PARAD|nr:hypothetical protein PanWU01x14_148130 [Parasponia andersonii]
MPKLTDRGIVDEGDEGALPPVDRRQEYAWNLMLRFRSQRLIVFPPFLLTKDLVCNFSNLGEKKQRKKEMYDFKTWLNLQSHNEPNLEIKFVFNVKVKGGRVMAVNRNGCDNIRYYNRHDYALSRVICFITC